MFITESLTSWVDFPFQVSLFHGDVDTAHIMKVRYMVGFLISVKHVIKNNARVNRNKEAFVIGNIVIPVSKEFIIINDARDHVNPCIIWSVPVCSSQVDKLMSHLIECMSRVSAIHFLFDSFYSLPTIRKGWQLILYVVKKRVNKYFQQKKYRLIQWNLGSFQIQKNTGHGNITTHSNNTILEKWYHTHNGRCLSRENGG